MKKNKMYNSKNYKQFKFILSNREINTKLLRKLIDNIKLYGQTTPIIVNVNKEIIDGQHRFCALMHLNKKIKYIINK